MFTSHKDSVNNRLHTLRGEQFRHSQNLLRSRSHITSANVTRLPSLPTDLFEYSDHIPPNDGSSSATSTSTPSLSYSGPEPPRSWTQASKDVSYKETSKWREQALSLIFEHSKTLAHDSSSQIPSLSVLCLSKFKDAVVPFIPSHLRRDLIRYASVESPLPNSKLYALFEPDGNADGEIIIIGPKATLRDDYFLHGHKDVDMVGSISSHSWDEETVVPKVLECFVLVSINMPISTLLTLPPTLTHLALIDLPNPIPLHRLCNVCPLLQVLDLSYNQWLTNCSKDVLNALDRIDWARWVHMRILGVRNCKIPEKVLHQVNRNRWDDVVIVQ
ncbi:hypothetical protein BDQ17DRAFT_1341708 [Cyathus striatus]|nr:hypothetical protein BDQ17DRAFT_1341708 [Cyathus striatus]